VEALFVVLADRGFFPEDDLNTLCQYKSHYIGHPTKKVKGVEQNTGSLGHGLPISVGVALAAKWTRKIIKPIPCLVMGNYPKEVTGKLLYVQLNTSSITFVPL
jgi:transketolase